MGKVLYIHKEKGRNTMPQITVFDVANYFLKKESIQHKKLQKLCYYSQAWHLAFYKDVLFNNNFEAWIHGPVCAELYNEYKSFRWNDIPQVTSIAENIKGYIKDFLDNVYKTYGAFTGDELECLTHIEQPWMKAREGLDDLEPSHNVINNNIMKEFYWEIYEKSQGV